MNNTNNNYYPQINEEIANKNKSEKVKIKKKSKSIEKRIIIKALNNDNNKNGNENIKDIIIKDFNNYLII